MIDMTGKIRRALLSACPRVYFYYPNQFIALPAVSFYDTVNTSEDQTDEWTKLAWQVDVWAKTVADCKATAAAADTAMRGLGFRRAFSASVPDPNGYRHQSMRYEGYYNALDSKIYSRS